MIEEREYMLKVIWRSVDVERHRLHTFKDNTECFFFRGLKLERTETSYQLYSTGMDAYPLVPDSAVWYAYNHGIVKLSDAMIRTKAEMRLSSPKYTQTPATVERLKEVINEAKDNNIPNLIQIKKDYESEQRENRQALQEV